MQCKTPVLAGGVLQLGGTLIARPALPYTTAGGASGGDRALQYLYNPDQKT